MAVLTYFYSFKTIVLILYLLFFVLRRSQYLLSPLFLTSTTAQPSSPVRHSMIHCVAGKRRTVGLMSTEAPSAIAVSSRVPSTRQQAHTHQAGIELFLFPSILCNRLPINDKLLRFLTFLLSKCWVKAIPNCDLHDTVHDTVSEGMCVLYRENAEDKNQLEAAWQGKVYIQS